MDALGPRSPSPLLDSCADSATGIHVTFGVNVCNRFASLSDECANPSIMSDCQSCGLKNNASSIAM